MQTAAARQNFRMSSGRIFPACARSRSRRNARFTSISATSALTYIETACIKEGVGIDLACGTGNLLFELKKRGIDVYVVDFSPEMLSQAKDKAYSDGMEDVLLLCQDMRKLDLYGTVDTVICALDSLNHLSGAADVQKTFDRVALFLNPERYFVFDMNTIYKHREILSNNTFVYETPEVLVV